MCCSVLQCVAVKDDIKRIYFFQHYRSRTSCVAVYRSVSQSVVACCNTLQYVAVRFSALHVCSAWQYVAVYCSVLQSVAVRGNAWQCIQCVAVCCSVLQLRAQISEGMTLFIERVRKCQKCVTTAPADYHRRHELVVMHYMHQLNGPSRTEWDYSLSLSRATAESLRKSAGAAVRPGDFF